MVSIHLLEQTRPRARNNQDVARLGSIKDSKARKAEFRDADAKYTDEVNYNCGRYNADDSPG